ITRAETITQIIAPSVIIDPYPGPNVTIIIGPRATLGKALKTTRYGSMIFENRFEYQRKKANNIPATVPIKKPDNVSKIVILKWYQSEPSRRFVIIICPTREGVLKISGSIQLSRLPTSQKTKR